MGRPKKYNTEEDRLESRRAASRLWYQSNKHKEVTAKCSFKQDKCNELRNHIGGTYCQYHYNVMSKSNKYNISPEDVLVLYDINTCNICNKSMSKKCIDHDHVTGIVRGMICHNCNLVLGYANDNIDILEKCIKYLNESKK